MVQGLQSIQRRTDRSGVEVHWAGLTEVQAHALVRGGLRAEHTHLDLDHALESMEELILSELEERPDIDLSMLEMLEDHCTRIELQAGTVVMEPNSEAGGDLFVVESGSLTAWGFGDDGERVRFRRFTRGSVVGEVGFLAGTERTATVITDDACVVLQLSTSTWESLRQTDPDFVFAVQTALSARVAERLAHTSSAYRRLVRGSQ